MSIVLVGCYTSPDNSILEVEKYLRGCGYYAQETISVYTSQVLDPTVGSPRLFDKDNTNLKFDYISFVINDKGEKLILFIYDENFPKITYILDWNKVVEENKKLNMNKNGFLN